MFANTCQSKITRSALII